MRFPAVLLLASAVAVLAAGCGGGGSRGTAPPPPPTDVQAEVGAAVELCDPGEGSSLDRMRVCFQRRLLAIVDEAKAPAAELPLIDGAVKAQGGFVQESCHVLMHWVGRTFALDRGVTLANLQEYLPKTNDPGCSAGFAHGLISALGKSVARLDPAAAARTCAASATRYQAYSCVHGLGHAFMRAYIETLPLALKMCSRLPRADVTDCAQGAFHDYWFAIGGVDGLMHQGPAPTPRELCGRQPARFVRACWYRAFLERPPATQLTTVRDVLAVCRDLSGLQRAGCITGASAVVSATNPPRQVTGCSRLAGGDAVACVHGVATQGLLDASLFEKVRLVRGCARFRGGTREPCVQWLSKALNVVSDGRFGGPGCRALPALDRAACVRGATSYRGPLETFS